MNFREIKNFNFKKFLLTFVIWFYRIIGISFGGINFDKNGTIIKSRFWNYFGYFGCIFHCLVTGIFLADTFINQLFKQFIQSKFTLIKLIIFIWQLLRALTIITIVITNQKYGFKIVKTFNDSLKNLNEIKQIKIIWIVHIFICFLKIIFDCATTKKYHMLNFITSYHHFMVVTPMTYSISFMSWIITMKFTRNIKQIRKLIVRNDGQFALTKLLNDVNKHLAISFSKINLVDQFLTFAFIFSAIETMFSILQFVYITVVFAKMFDYLFYYSLPIYVIFLIQLILNCFINGILYEETEKLIFDLDNLNINVNHIKLFESFISLKTQLRNIKCGFTIGSFAPWNKLTLLQVIYIM